MDRHMKSALCVGIFVLAAQGVQAAQITFYEGEGFRGRAFTTKRPVTNFKNLGFNDRASSVVVDSGDWIVCDDSEYRGRCVLLRRGAYDSLRGLGVDNRISSVRQADRRQGDYAEAPTRLEAPNYEYRRRAYEPVYEARVTSARVGGSRQCRPLLDWNPTGGSYVYLHEGVWCDRMDVNRDGEPRE